jgi:hypothetical protein
VVLVRQDEEDVLKDCDEELVEERVRSLHVRLLGNVVDQLQAHVQPGSLDVAVVVLAGPQAGIDDELELPVVQLQEGCGMLDRFNSYFSNAKHTWETVKVNGPKEVEELHTVLGELGEVFVDHVQSALKDVLHNHWHLVLHKALEHNVSSALQSAAREINTYRKLGNHGCHGPQNLSVASTSNVPVVINQDGFEELRHHLRPNSLEILRLVHKRLDELEDFLFDGAKAADLGHLGRDFTWI